MDVCEGPRYRYINFESYLCLIFCDTLAPQPDMLKIRIHVQCMCLTRKILLLEEENGGREEGGSGEDRERFSYFRNL